MASVKKAKASASKKALRFRAETVTAAPRDLSKGVIVVLSGGGFDGMNPPEVRARMDRYIDDVNADAYVQANTGGLGLKYKVLPGQTTKHLHQTKWRQICSALNLLQASPLILVGHSNGGAAVVDLARCLNSQGKAVDLLFTCDSVLTLDDNGDVNKAPPNVKLNFNPYVIPTLAWILAPFPIGKPNHRQIDGSMDDILNIGLAYNLGGAFAHRNAFYEIAGGDTQGSGFKRPNLLLDVTLAVLRGETNYNIIHNAVAPLQVLATKSHLVIKLATTNFTQTLNP
ncbi:MAG: hypothetical protein ABI995_15145 [Acidobacteriota bacterium]